MTRNTGGSTSSSETERESVFTLLLSGVHPASSLKHKVDGYKAADTQN
jgi:hypothetical protein